MSSTPIPPGPPPPPIAPSAGSLTPLSTSLSTSCCENGRPIITDPHTGQSVCSCQYGSGLLSAYSRVSGLGESMYTSPHYPTQGYMPLNTDSSAFYSPLVSLFCYLLSLSPEHLRLYFINPFLHICLHLLGFLFLKLFSDEVALTFPLPHSTLMFINNH